MFMFDQGQLKIMVKGKDFTLYDCILSPLFMFWTPVGIYKSLSWNVNYDETMRSSYVCPRLVQGQRKKLTLFPMLHMGYSSFSVIAFVYDFTFLYKKIWFHPVTYGGRHGCFRFRKHPSNFER